MKSHHSHPLSPLSPTLRSWMSARTVSYDQLNYIMAKSLDHCLEWSITVSAFLNHLSRHDATSAQTSRSLVMGLSNKSQLGLFTSRGLSLSKMAIFVRYYSKAHTIHMSYPDNEVKVTPLPIVIGYAVCRLDTAQTDLRYHKNTRLTLHL